MKINKIIIAFLATLWLIGCDVIDKPFEESNVVINDTTKIYKKILLEDYTGFTCPNCPKAAEVIHELMKDYSESLIPIAVHSGYFAKPKSGTAPSFKYDFRTDVGDEWDKTFENSAAGNPNGLINRLNNHKIYTYGEWASVIAENLNKLADFKLTINANLNEASNAIVANIEIKALSNLENQYKLSVILIQDSIVDYQQNGNVIDSIYQHNHVLRASFNGSWGEEVISSSIKKDDILNKQYSLTVKTDSKHPWKKPYLKVIAFIYDAKTYEIMQAEEAPVK